MSRDRLTRRGEKSNVCIDSNVIDSARESSMHNYSYVDRFIISIIEKLKRLKENDDVVEIPTDRYTTF